MHFKSNNKEPCATMEKEEMDFPSQNHVNIFDSTSGGNASSVTEDMAGLMHTPTPYWLLATWILEMEKRHERPLLGLLHCQETYDVIWWSGSEFSWSSLVVRFSICGLEKSRIPKRARGERARRKKKGWHHVFITTTVRSVIIIIIFWRTSWCSFQSFSTVGYKYSYSLSLLPAGRDKAHIIVMRITWLLLIASANGFGAPNQAE